MTPSKQRRGERRVEAEQTLAPPAAGELEQRGHVVAPQRTSRPAFGPDPMTGIAGLPMAATRATGPNAGRARSGSTGRGRRAGRRPPGKEGRVRGASAPDRGLESGARTAARRSRRSTSRRAVWSPRPGTCPARSRPAGPRRRTRRAAPAPVAVERERLLGPDVLAGVERREPTSACAAGIVRFTTSSTSRVGQPARLPEAGTPNSRPAPRPASGSRSATTANVDIREEVRLLRYSSLMSPAPISPTPTGPVRSAGRSRGPPDEVGAAVGPGRRRGRRVSSSSMTAAQRGAAATTRGSHRAPPTGTWCPGVGEIGPSLMCRGDHPVAEPAEQRPGPRRRRPPSTCRPRAPPRDRAGPAKHSSGGPPSICSRAPTSGCGSRPAGRARQRPSRRCSARPPCRRRRRRSASARHGRPDR